MSQEDRKHIAQAVAEAGQTTHAHLACVVAPASDAYQSYVFFYSFILASLIDIGLWMTRTLTEYPFLLAIQLVSIALISAVPFLRQLCLKLVPRHVLHHRAAHRAFEEYMVASRHAQSTSPVLLVYVSVAERYVHILPSRMVRDHIPDMAWNGVVRELTQSVASKGLRDACIHGIRQAGKLLATHFPIH